MPTIIRLTTMPGNIQRGGHSDMVIVFPFGPSLGREDATIRNTVDVAPAVRTFGERVRAEHPEASFKIVVSIVEGQRKPRGFDAAAKAGAFGNCAFMLAKTKGGQRITKPV